MKKAFSILVVIMLLTSTVAYADQHLEAQCLIAGEKDSRVVTLDLYETEEEITAVSSLFPEYAVRLKQRSSGSVDFINLLCEIDSKKAAAAVEWIDNITGTWLQTRLSSKVSGVYSGELFDSASAVRYAEAPLSELADYLQEKKKNTEISVSGETDAFCNFMADVLTEAINTDLHDRDLILSVRDFDDGRYTVVRIMESEDVIMTVSVERADANKKHLLIGYRQNDRYCFRELLIGTEQNVFYIRSNMRTSTVSSFRAAAEREPLFESDLTINEGTAGIITFQYTLNSGKLKNPLIISGQTQKDPDGYSDVKCSVSVGNLKTEFITADFLTEPIVRPASFDDKTIVLYENMKDNAAISMEVASAVLELTAWLLPVLPQEYQQILQNMMTP